MASVTDTKDHLLLKWGTLKGWHFEEPNEAALTLLREYHDIGAALGAMQQRDTPRQKEIICELIDLCEGTITNDWDGIDYSKVQAKQYVMDYPSRAQKAAVSDKERSE